MFSSWRFSQARPSSYTLSYILKQKNPNLESLLQEDDVIQEAMADETKLCNFILQPETLSKMLDIITTPPADSSSSDRKFKIPYVATEVIMALHSKALPRLFQPSENPLASSLIHFFSSTSPLPSTHLQFVQRILSSLLHNHESETLLLFASHPSFPRQLVTHAATSATALDLFLKLLTPDRSLSCYEWLARSGVVEHFVEILVEGLQSDSSPHWLTSTAHASEALRQIITVSLTDDKTASYSFSTCPLFLRLMSPSTGSLESLYNAIMDTSSPIPTLQPLLSVLVTLAQRIVSPSTLIDNDCPSLDDDLVEFVDHDRIKNTRGSRKVLIELWGEEEAPGVDQLTSRICNFCADSKFLLHLNHLLSLPCPPMSSSFSMFSNSFTPLIGKGKLSILKYCRLITCCGFFNEILDSGCLKTAFELFFEYPHFSVLHSSVVDLVYAFIDLKTSEHKDYHLKFLNYLLDECDLITKLPLETKKSLEVKPRPAFIGDLISLGKVVLETIPLEEIAERNDQWKWFESDVIQPTVSKITEKGHYSVNMASSDFSDDDYGFDTSLMDSGSSIFNQILVAHGQSINADFDDIEFDWSNDDVIFDSTVDESAFDFESSLAEISVRDSQKQEEKESKEIEEANEEVNEEVNKEVNKEVEELKEFNDANYWKIDYASAFPDL
ncbi:hypothetical protein P9112_013720 [Eukaryota sp. TZLM1-RC]